jgi:ABC-2 type transport system ATP-binding protein
MSAAIEIQALSKEYKSRGRPPLRAVDNLSLTIETGQVLAFLGPNGAGKTTTIKMICGLVTPSSGTVKLNGFDVARQRSQAMRQIGAVLEGTRNVYWRLSAWENLLYFGRLKGVSGPALKERAERLLRELDLWDRRSDEVRLFSRGMQQKVAIAAALIADPPIILLDEPTLGLDVQASRTVKQWVERLAREEGKTVVLTTHQLDMAEDICNDVAIINKGKLLTNQPVARLLNLFRQEFYQIRVGGIIEKEETIRHLNVHEEDGETTVTGAIKNQGELFNLLEQFRSQGVPLLSVTRTDPDLEEIFVRMLNQEKLP